MSMGTIYEVDLTGKSPMEVADLISDWRTNNDAFLDESIDLLNSIEAWLLTIKEAA